MISLIYRIKFLLAGKGELYSYLKNTLGFTPHGSRFYELALTHRSATFKTKESRHNNNERLEFLGDAVIETVSSISNTRRGFSQHDAQQTCGTQESGQIGKGHKP